MIGALDIPFVNVYCTRAVTGFIEVKQLNLTERVADNIYVKPINLLCFSIFFHVGSFF